ncbi:TPA: BppU family phage baseplate upper protein [Enterococcus faecium]
MTNKVLNLDFSKDPIMMPAIIYGRVGDDNSQTVTVNVTKRNEIFDLTGGSLTFEGVTKGGTTQVFDSDNISTTAEGLKKGTFDYTFPNAAFAVEGKYERAYFSFVKDGKRDTTSSFEIIVFGNADIDAEEAETIITEYNKLIEQLHELYQQTIDKVTGEYDQFHQQITKKMNEMETIIQNANADLTALKTKVDEIKQIIENLDNLSVMYSNSIDFGGYDYSGNPNLSAKLNASSFSLGTGATVADDNDEIVFTLDGTNQLSKYASKAQVPVAEGKQYTISCEIMLEDGFTGDPSGIRLQHAYLPGGVAVLQTETVPKNELNTWQTLIGTRVVKYTSDAPNEWYPLFRDIRNLKPTGKVRLRKIKIEEGPTATPYQPNLLDAPYYLSKVALGENIADPTVSFPIKTSAYRLYGVNMLEEFKVGQRYTITIKGTKPATQDFWVFNSGDVSLGKMKPVEGLSDIWTLTFTPNAVNSSTPKLLAIYQTPQSTAGACQIDWLKIEKGDTRTPNIGEYKYRGTGMRDSNNPYDYVWDIEPSYVENNLATDIKVAEITGKANNYTDGKVAQVNSNLLKVINTLEKRVSTNSNNILDNTTNIGKNTSSITSISNTLTEMQKPVKYEAWFSGGTELRPANANSRFRVSEERLTIGTKLNVAMNESPLEWNADRWEATFTRECSILVDVQTIVEFNDQWGTYVYINMWKDTNQTQTWDTGYGMGIASGANFWFRTELSVSMYCMNAKVGDKFSIGLGMASGKSLTSARIHKLHIMEL